MIRTTKVLSLCLLAGLLGARTARADNVELRIASLAPSGSPWMEVLDKAAAEVKDKTAGRVTLKYFEGGQQGDERDFVRKIKLGQLDGAAVTAVGLSMIDESIRVLELPMMFQSAEELDYVADKMWPYFQKKFEKKGFKLNDRGEVGWVYFLSKSEVKSLDDLKGGDPETNANLARRVLAGEQGPHRDIVLLNAAAGLVASGRADDLKVGLDMARESIDSDRAAEIVDRLVAVSHDAATPT